MNREIWIPQFYLLGQYLTLCKLSNFRSELKRLQKAKAGKEELAEFYKRFGEAMLEVYDKGEKLMMRNLREMLNEEQLRSVRWIEERNDIIKE